jgi:hypothetical protein
LRVDFDPEFVLEPLLLLLLFKSFEFELLFELSLLSELPFELELLFELMSELRLALELEDWDLVEVEEERELSLSMVLLAATSLTLPEELSSRILRPRPTESRASIGARGLASATQATTRKAKRRESELLKRMVNERKSSVGKPKKECARKLCKRKDEILVVENDG